MSMRGVDCERAARDLRPFWTRLKVWEVGSGRELRALTGHSILSVPWR